MAANLEAFLGRIASLKEPNSGLIKGLAKECAEHPDNVDGIVTALYTKIKESVGKEKLAGWYLLDAAIKSTSFGRSQLAAQVQRDLLSLASEHLPWTSEPASVQKYTRLVESWRQLFGDAEVNAVLSLKDLTVSRVKEQQKGVVDQMVEDAAAAAAPAAAAAAPVVATSATATAAAAGAAAAVMPLPPTSNLPEPPRAGAMPSYEEGRGGGERERVASVPVGELAPFEQTPEGQQASGAMPLHPPTQEMQAPPKPAEVERVVPLPRKQRDAPDGHIATPSADKVQQYLKTRRDNLKDLMSKAKRKREEMEESGRFVKAEEDEAIGDEDPDESPEARKKRVRRIAKKKIARLVTQSRYVAQAKDTTKWPTMPEDFPRDPETGVRIGNYIDGVVFIRDAIRDAGGALELKRLNNKIPQVQSLANRIKSVREFIDVHTPTTFRVTKEEEEIIVRLSEDPPPQAGETPSWISTPCPDCGKIVPGHNLPKHRNSKRCIGKQMLLGQEGKGRSVISQLSQFSYRVLRTLQEKDNETGDPRLDDDDLMYFWKLIEKAASNFRTRHSRKGDWTHIFRAIQAIHQFWLDTKNVESSADVVIDTSAENFCEDRAKIKFLEVVGSNMFRLPISYMEFGEFQAMCGPFVPTEGFKPPAPNPPWFGSTNVRPKECACPGFVFCDSDPGSDNPPDSDKESDDDHDKEAPTAAPLSFSQALATVGTDDQADKGKLLRMAASAIEWKRSNHLQHGDQQESLQIQYGGPGGPGAPPGGRPRHLSGAAPVPMQRPRSAYDGGDEGAGGAPSGGGAPVPPQGYVGPGGPGGPPGFPPQYAQQFAGPHGGPPLQQPPPMPPHGFPPPQQPGFPPQHYPPQAPFMGQAPPVPPPSGEDTSFF